MMNHEHEFILAIAKNALRNKKQISLTNLLKAWRFLTGKDWKNTRMTAINLIGDTCRHYRRKERILDAKIVHAMFIDVHGRLNYNDKGEKISYLLSDDDMDDLWNKTFA